MDNQKRTTRSNKDLPKQSKSKGVKSGQPLSEAHDSKQESGVSSNQTKKTGKGRISSWSRAPPAPHFTSSLSVT